MFLNSNQSIAKSLPAFAVQIIQDGDTKILISVILSLISLLFFIFYIAFLVFVFIADQ